MKTNRELNTKHEKDQILKVRPKQPNYDFTREFGTAQSPKVRTRTVAKKPQKNG